MISVEEAIITRLVADNAVTGNLQTLLGGASRIVHALEPRELKVGSITYQCLASVPGDLRTKNVEVKTEIYQFNIYHHQYEVVADRIYRLLHLYRFSTPSDAGIKSCVWDWEGPDEFDGALKVGLKRVQYKLEVVRSAQSPV